MKKLFVFAIAIVLNLSALSSVPNKPQQTLKELRSSVKPKLPKLSPDLEDLLTQDDADEAARLQGKTLAEVRRERLADKTQAKTRNAQTVTSEAASQRRVVHGAWLPSSEVEAEEPQRFIVQINGNALDVVVQEKLALLGARISQQPDRMGLMVIEAPRTAIRHIAAVGNVSYVSPDRAVMAMGHLETTTGAALIRATSGYSSMDGSGIGVAVIDSGVDEAHELYDTGFSVTAVKTKKDFSSGEYKGTEDPYGHGTHVAGLLAGDASSFSAQYHGVATGANLINLRVLDADGKGTTAQVIAALNWCVANKSKYNIRVINLSLGTMAKDSYKYDPLCLAARAAVTAGIVVVAAAGNDGKAANGQKIYGGIHSPGIDPSVITVGAANSYGTDSRADDTVTTYSSRGPTRGYVTVNGVRKYDNLIKPDLIAPGNKLISAASGTAGNKLLQQVPSLLTNPLFLFGDNSDNKMMYLSGTSMSAPVVSGAVAMMLEANPKLTPNLVKAILMYSAQPLKGFNMLEQGAGLLNIDGAVRLAKLVKTTLPTTNGSALLVASLPTQQSTIAGTTFKWGQGVLTNYGFLTGNNLLTQWQAVYGSGQVLGDATMYANSTLSIVSGKTSGGVSLKAGAIQINGTGVILGDSINSIFASGQVLGDGTILGDSIIIGDGIILGDGVILGDGTTRADTTLRSTSRFLGDNTACMQPSP